jgi:hypothetical protein
MSFILSRSPTSRGIGASISGYEANTLLNKKLRPTYITASSLWLPAESQTPIASCCVVK